MGQDTWQDHMTNRESHDRQEQGTRQNPHRDIYSVYSDIVFSISTCNI